MCVCVCQACLWGQEGTPEEENTAGAGEKRQGRADSWQMALLWQQDGSRVVAYSYIAATLLIMFPPTRPLIADLTAGSDTTGGRETRRWWMSPKKTRDKQGKGKSRMTKWQNLFLVLCQFP